MKTMSAWKLPPIRILVSLLLTVTCSVIPDLTTEAAAHPESESSTLNIPAMRKKASRAQNEEGVRETRASHDDLAELAFRRALTYDPNNLTAVFNLAGVLLNSQRVNQAIALLEKYARHSDSYADLSARLGDAYFTAKRVAEAEQAYERALSLVPDYPGLPIKLATLYGLKQDFKRAEQMLELATAQTPNDAQILNNLGNLYILNGKSEKAIAAAKQALQIRTSKESYLTLGSAYETQRDYENSLIAFQRARDLGASSPELVEKIEKMRSSAAAGG